MDEEQRQITPPPDEAFLASVPPEFSATTTEDELLAIDPAVLNSPPRYSSEDRNAKRVMFRIARYIELLQTNSALAKRCIGELASTLHRQREPILPPPAFPFDDHDWHKWLLQPAPLRLGAEEFFDLGPMPLPAPWGQRGPFSHSLDLIEYIDATWEKPAQAWREDTERAVARAEALLESEKRSQHAREPDPAPFAAPAFVTDRVLGHLNPIDVYLRDPSAPTLRRHCYYVAYALFPVPAAEGTTIRATSSRTPVYRRPDQVYIRSNVDYIPPLPSTMLPILRTDGRLGAHEISRYAQWHEVGQWHHAFIPLNRRDGRAHLNEHSTISSKADMAWYVPDLANHYTDCGSGFFIMKEHVAFWFSRFWEKSRDEFAASLEKSPTLLGPPYAALDMGRRAWDLLRTHQLRERDIIETLATMQRCVLEMRGWMEFVRCRMWLKRFQQRNGNPSILPPADARLAQTRRWTRGVFTHSPDIAMRYGQYGVPVFLVQIVKGEFVPPSTDFVPEGPIVINHLLRYRYAVHAWNDARPAIYLAAVQEPGYLVRRQSDLQQEGFGGDDDAVMADDDPPIDDDVPKDDVPKDGAPPADATMDDAPPVNDSTMDDDAPQVDDAPPVNDSAMDDDAPPVNDSTMDDVTMDDAPPTGGAVRPAEPSTSVGPQPDLVVEDRAVAPAGAGSKKRSRDAGTSASAATSAPVKRRKEEESSQPNETSQEAAVKFRFPYTRRRKDVPLPAWWPQECSPSTSPRIPVDWFSFPIMEHFMGRKDELKCSRMIGGWLKSRANRMRQFETMPIAEVPRWSAGDWRTIVSNNSHARVQVAWARNLGFPMDPEPERVLVEEPPHSMPLEREEDEPNSGRSSPAPSTALSMASTETSGPPSTVASTAPTTRAPSEDGDSDRYDSDMEEDMTQVDREGRRIHPENSCFVAVVDGRTADGSFLAREDERYLKEPPGWRRKAPGQLRGYKDFRLFVEEAHDEDGVLEFQEIGQSRRTEYDDYREFWDYEGGRILFLLNTMGQRRGGGEQLTNRIRLLRLGGGKARSPEPIQLRIWPAQSFQASLYVPRDALGAVGSRARTANFRVSDEDYEKMFPGAPSQRALETPTTGASSSEVPAPSSTQALTRSDVSRSVVHMPATNTSISPASSSAPAQTLVVPEPASLTTPHMQLPTTSTSTSAASSSVPARTPMVPEPTPVKARVDYWAAKGAVDVPKQGAPMPLYDLLAPKGTIFFNQHVLPPFADKPGKDYAWPTASWRKVIIWDLAELTFRTAVFALDDYLRRTYPEAQELNEEPVLERQRMVCAIWEDSSFAPKGPSPLTAVDWRARMAPLRAFHRIVSTWPRTGLPSPPAQFASEAELNIFEVAVWRAYAQTYSDYFSREPPVPLVYPDQVPWDSVPE